MFFENGFGRSLGNGTVGGGQKAMKIYFLLMIISVFVGLSYVPLRGEAKRPATDRAH
jgi:hypothetical protein